MGKAKQYGTPLTYAAFVAVLILVAALIYGWTKYNNLSKNLVAVQDELSKTKTELQGSLSEGERLSSTLSAEQAKNAEFETKINDIAGTVSSLDKLSKTDKELLQKYSKVYFLNEHYVPSDLATITPEFIFQKERDQFFHEKALIYLSSLVRAASDEGHSLLVISAYRSFGDQSALKGQYLVTYGSGANKFSADQGYSEHQLGTAVDFTTGSLGSSFTGFANSPEFKWLEENAYRYGFVLSYNKGNVYYQYEPWHWRFVGVKLAAMLKNEGKNFYDVDQRIINNYLLTIFDR